MRKWLWIIIMVNQILAPFHPLPWQIAPWRDTSKVVLATGSAGGGKSRFAAEKIHGFMLKYPKATGLMVRKTRDSMTNSTVLFMETEVIGRDPFVKYVRSSHRFEYANGSVLLYGGMADEQQRNQVRSIGLAGGVDFIWMEEGNAFVESDYNELIARLRGQAAPWRQILITTNPDAPQHWINQRLIIGGEANVYYSSAIDNTYNPSDYADTLRRITGVLGQRLRDGLWVSAEGAIYDNWSQADNVTVEAEYEPTEPIYWAIDDGYADGHPRVILLFQYTAQGGMHVFYEYVKTHELEEQTIDAVLALGYPEPYGAFIDSSAAQLRSRLHTKGIQTIPSTHTVAEGIKNMRRLIGDGNGVRLLKVHPRCKVIQEEVLSYAYDTAGQAVNGEPRPLKEHDHTMDAIRYGAWRLRNA